jgi:hypothetical protein
MRSRALTGVARPLDFSYAGNLWIAAAAVGTFLAVLLWFGLAADKAPDWLGADWISAAGAAALAGLGTFLAWAIGRELDPDRPAAAVLASLLAIAGMLVLGPPGIGACFVVLLAVRVLNRTTGVPATPPDGVLLLGLGVWIALDGGWIYLVAPCAALLGDGLLARELRRFVWALAGAVASFGLLYVLGGPEVPLAAASSPEAAVVAVLAALLLLPTMRGAGDVQSVGDAGGRPLEPVRVRAGQALALGVGVVAAIERGFAGLEMLMPLWAAVLASGLYGWLPGGAEPTERGTR